MIRERHRGHRRGPDDGEETTVSVGTRGERDRFGHLIERAIRKPRLVLPYLRRRLRNRRIRARTSTHPEFYRQVMASDVAAKSAHGAVGTADRERWLRLGRLQFDHLTSHGLEPGHRLLEIGCGNLRAGWRLIEYLDPGNYTGVDISPDILIAAERTVVEHRLQDRRPALFLVDGTRLDFLPREHFDAIHAHSVFSHTPLDVVGSYLREAWEVMRRGAFFDFTYNESGADIWGFLDEDYYFPRATLLELGSRLGFEATPVEDWDHPQRKIRLVKPPGGHGIG